MGYGNLSLVFGPTIMRSPRSLDADLADSGLQVKVSEQLCRRADDFLFIMTLVSKIVYKIRSIRK